MIREVSSKSVEGQFSIGVDLGGTNLRVAAYRSGKQVAEPCTKKGLWGQWELSAFSSTLPPYNNATAKIRDSAVRAVSVGCGDRLSLDAADESDLAVHHHRLLMVAVERMLARVGLAADPRPARERLDGVANLSRSLNKRDEALEQLLAHAKKVTDTLAQRAGQVNQLITDGPCRGRRRRAPASRRRGSQRAPTR